MALIFALFAPLVGAGGILLWDRSALRGIKYTALAASLAGFVFALMAFLAFDHTNPQFQMVVSQAWIASIDAGFRIGVDGMGILFVLLTSLTMPVAVLASFTTIKEREKHWYAMLLLLQFSITGIFMALDTFLFYTFFELLLIPMYFIIGIWGGEGRIYAALKFFIYTMLGSMIMLVALVWLGLYAQEQTGHFTTNLLALRGLSPSIDLTTQRWLFWAFALSFCIKIPLFPFHTWLPDVQKEAPVVGSVIVGAALFKIGVYGLIRFVLELTPQASFAYAPVMCWLGVIAVMYGGLIALVQTDIKRMAAYALVCSLGVVVMGVFSMTTEGLQGAIIQTFNHGLSVSALFLCIGMVSERRQSTQLSDFGGLARTMPVFTVFFAISVFSLVGLPGLNGFVGEYLLLLGTFRSPFLNTWIFGILGAVSGTLVAAYLLKLFQKVAFGTSADIDYSYLPDLKPIEITQLVPATVLMIWIGVYPSAFMKYSEESTKALVGKLEVLKFGTTSHATPLNNLHIAPMNNPHHQTAPARQSAQQLNEHSHQHDNSKQGSSEHNNSRNNTRTRQSLSKPTLAESLPSTSSR
jgi:NADH-quinone oxidoreductase subunit M